MMKMTQNRSSAAKAPPYRHNETVVSGHAIDQFLDRSPLQYPGEGIEHFKMIGRMIAENVRAATLVHTKGVDPEDGGVFKLYRHGQMGYIVKMFRHYRKVITCYVLDSPDHGDTDETR